MFTLLSTKTNTDIEKMVFMWKSSQMSRNRYQYRIPTVLYSFYRYRSLFIYQSLLCKHNNRRVLRDNVHLCSLLLCNWFLFLGQTTGPFRPLHKREMCSDREELSKPARKKLLSFNITNRNYFLYSIGFTSKQECLSALCRTV